MGVGRNVNWCSHYGKQYGGSSGSLKKKKKELSYHPTIPLLGIYPDKTVIQRDTGTSVFTAALFIIAKSRKQPKCPSTDEWIKKTWYIYTMEQDSAVKRNEIMPLTTLWMQLEIGLLSAVSQKEKDRCRMTSLVCRI